MTIVVIDDEFQNAEMRVTYFKDAQAYLCLGHVDLEVLMFSSSRSALSQVKGKRVDGFVLDLMIPSEGEDGHVLLGSIVQDANLRVPVLLSSQMVTSDVEQVRMKYPGLRISIDPWHSDYHKAIDAYGQFLQLCIEQRR